VLAPLIEIECPYVGKALRLVPEEDS
jgi:hypothetical protein